jgi:MoaA/NifB/PqqE/SkfB family radical SAM enzyme
MTSHQDETTYEGLLDSLNRASIVRALRVIFCDTGRTLRILAGRPSRIPAGAGILLHQKKAAALRKKAGLGASAVPFMLFISITSGCNLSCAGCYMHDRKQVPGQELSFSELTDLIGQAEALGIAIIGLVGGEPLLRKNEVIALARAFPRLLFTLNTNGLLIDRETAEGLAGCPNLIPLISIEGFRSSTDTRRGEGVFDRLTAACRFLDPRVLFFGCAVTVTRSNIGEVLGEPFIRTMIATGVRAFIFIQYVPAWPDTADLVPTPEERELVIRSMAEFNRKYPAFFASVPGEMEMFGGCLAAGRGFVHINAIGDLEPCPIVPVSDTNIRDMPLKEAIRSPLLRTIRRNHRALHANGRCVLRTNPQWLEEQLSME